MLTQNITSSPKKSVVDIPLFRRLSIMVVNLFKGKCVTELKVLKLFRAEIFILYVWSFV